MNLIQDDPRTEEALAAFVVAAADLAQRLDARRGALPASQRVVLDALNNHVHRAQAIAENVFSAAIFSSK